MSAWCPCPHCTARAIGGTLILLDTGHKDLHRIESGRPIVALVEEQSR